MRQLPRGYWQEFIAGRVLGVTCLITDAGVRWLGATEALTSDQWQGPSPYVYRGSLGPLHLDAQHSDTSLARATRVGQQLHYRGYLQADLIEDAHGRLWLLEINPRWTAGMEILQLCCASAGSSPLAAHLSAYGIDIATEFHLGAPETVLAAKAVLYAPRDLRLAPEQRARLQSFRQRQPRGHEAWWNIADVPAISADAPLTFGQGQPVLTLRVGLYANSGDWAQARQTLLAGLEYAHAQVMTSLFDAAQSPARA
jgi:hypothetical protein